MLLFEIISIFYCFLLSGGLFLFFVRDCYTKFVPLMCNWHQGLILCQLFVCMIVSRWLVQLEMMNQE